MRFLNELEDPAEDITEEVEDESDQHQVFFTGTAAELSPIRSIDKITIGDGRRGPVTAAIQHRFFDVINGIIQDTHGWLTYVYPARAATLEPVASVKTT